MFHGPYLALHRAAHARKGLCVVFVLYVVALAGAARGEPPPQEAVAALQRADPARAQHIEQVARVIGAFSCPLPDARVAIVSDPHITDLAESRRDKSGRLSIHYRLDKMVLFSVPTVTFWLMHECEHHLLGGTRAEKSHMTGTARVTAERRADCRAIQDLVAADVVGVQDLGKIDHDLSALSGGGFYESGPHRADHVLACAAQEMY